MFNHVNTSNQMYAKYLQSNPQYKDLKSDELLKQMLADGAITQEEYNKIKNGDTFKFSFEETNNSE